MNKNVTAKKNIQMLLMCLDITILVCTMAEHGWMLPKRAVAGNVFLYVFICIFIFIILGDFFISHKNKQNVKNIPQPQKREKKNTEVDKEQLNIRAIHEAGHVVMGNALNVKVKEKTIKRGKHDIGHVSYEIGGSLIPEDIKKVVLLNYAGLIAERLLLGVASSGCMGSDNADLEQASICLKRYILLTDTEISLAGGECERVELHKKMKKLSKEFEQIAVNILKQRIPEIEREKEKLLNDYYKDLEKNK